jgi:hypothetical protein
MREPLYRLAFDAALLLREHPPRFHHPHKIALFEMAYPNGESPAGEIEVTRWNSQVPQPLHLASAFEVVVRPDFYDYIPSPDISPRVEWHVNFADPRLFGAYSSGLLAQDEMQVVEHPLLASVREALLAKGLAAKTSDETGPTPMLVRAVERRIALSTEPNASAGRPHGIYGNRFMAAPLDVVLRAARRVSPATYSNIIAMAAPSGGDGDYTEREIEHIFATAFTAFAAARQESSASSGASIQTAVHSGFWGCGAFGGNRKLMVALQALAARAAGINRLVLHAANLQGAEEATTGFEVADSVAQRCGASCSLDTLVGRCAILGYRWGVSDGN